MEQITMVFWEILPVLLTIAIPSVVLIFGWLTKRLTAKMDVEHQVLFNKLIMEIVFQGVAYAEEIAKKKAKDNQELNNDQKLFIATRYIIEMLEKNGVIELTGEEIAKYIDSILGYDTMQKGADYTSIITEGDEDDEDHFGD